MDVGQGSISVAPDLATLDLGVETGAANASEANSQASAAMDAIVEALEARGVKDEDIQTSRFRVYPRYNYVEEEVDGVRTSREVLTGCRVRNNATVKLRDLDTLEEAIEEVVTAGGDDVRINGINFTLEDPKPMMAELRERAVADARAKAEHLAELSDVTVGCLIYISEGATGPPVGGLDTYRWELWPQSPTLRFCEHPASVVARLRSLQGFRQDSPSTSLARWRSYNAGALLSRPHETRVSDLFTTQLS